MSSLDPISSLLLALWVVFLITWNNWWKATCYTRSKENFWIYTFCPCSPRAHKFGHWQLCRGPNLRSDNELRSAASWDSNYETELEAVICAPKHNSQIRATYLDRPVVRLAPQVRKDSKAEKPWFRFLLFIHTVRSRNLWPEGSQCSFVFRNYIKKIKIPFRRPKDWNIAQRINIQRGNAVGVLGILFRRPISLR